VIPARKSALFNAWFAGHARGRIHKTFGNVLIRGLEAARSAAESAPVLVVSNHTSWWDPLVVLHLSQHLLKTDGYALMDAKNLRRLPFFALVGGFGVDLDQPADGAAGIMFAARLLREPGRLVWLFPQGRERPVTERPLGFKPGAAEIARVAKKAVTIPAALRYEVAGEEKPRIYVSFGEAIGAERDVERGREKQEIAVAKELDRIEQAARGDADEFASVHRAKPPWIGAVAERLLAILTRPRDGIRQLAPGERPTDRP
jgi:1-acyl-sn-glycerol-3-phosphate acyltransferase